jgi:hypothetical protein
VLAHLHVLAALGSAHTLEVLDLTAADAAAQQHQHSSNATIIIIQEPAATIGAAVAVRLLLHCVCSVACGGFSPSLQSHRAAAALPLLLLLLTGLLRLAAWPNRPSHFPPSQQQQCSSSCTPD